MRKSAHYEGNKGCCDDEGFHLGCSVFDQRVESLFYNCENTKRTVCQYGKSTVYEFTVGKNRQYSLNRGLKMRLELAWE